MAAASTMDIPPSLYDLALQTFIQTNPLGGKIPPFQQISREADFALSRWQYLKESNPLGLLDIGGIMGTIETNFHISKPLNLRQVKGVAALIYQQNFPKNFPINILFHELQRRIEIEFKTYGYTLEKYVPTRLDAFAHIQQMIHNVEEARALEKLWQKLVTTQQIRVEEPKPTTIPEMYAWLTNPDNAEQIEQIPTLDLSDQHMKVLPGIIGLFRGLRQLHLHGNHLKYLPEPLCHLTGLTELYLNNNDLVELPKPFGNLKNLRELKINRNALIKLPESFVDLTSLTDLSCHSNHLIALPKDFGNLKALTRLKLDNNRLIELPESFGQLTALTELYLHTNHLVTLPASFANLKGLIELSLASNYFTRFPEQLNELIALQKLDLCDNMLKTLPDYVGQLTALKRLNLAYNSLEEIPNIWGELNALETLYLSHNRLSYIPSSFAALNALAELSLASNNLAIFPDVLSELTTLQGLDLCDNMLKTLPDSIGQLTSLKRLSLANNCLEEIPDIWGQFTALETLYFSYNRLRYIPPSLSCLSLPFLDLQHNDLEHLPEESRNLTELNSRNLDTLATSRKRKAETSLPGEPAAMRRNLGAGFITSLPSLQQQPLETFLWQNLKNNAPAGLINIPKLMHSIEKLFQTSQPHALKLKDPRNKNSLGFAVAYQHCVATAFRADWLFHALHKELDDRYKKVGMTQGREIFTTSQELKVLQSAVQGMRENQALKETWPKIRQQLQSNGLISVYDGTDQSWLTDPTHRDGIQRVQMLDLSILKTKTLPRELSLFRGLQILILKGNPNGDQKDCLQFLPESISELPSLVALDLSNNNLEKLPKSFGNLISLKGLNLDNNQLTKLPKSFGRLTSLIELIASQNLLTKLPNSFTQLTSLNKVDLSHNLLIKLPRSFGQLKNLRVLNLNHNHLGALPPSFSMLTNLNALGLHENHLKELSLPFKEFTTLEELGFGDNCLKELPPSFGELPALTYLDLQGNFLRELPGSFNQLTSLRFLGLKNNPLEQIPHGLFETAVEIEF